MEMLPFLWQIPLKQNKSLVGKPNIVLWRGYKMLGISISKKENKIIRKYLRREQQKRREIQFSHFFVILFFSLYLFDCCREVHFFLLFSIIICKAMCLVSKFNEKFICFIIRKIIFLNLISFPDIEFFSDGKI